MKQGFETPRRQARRCRDAFKDPQHPFRVAIVCAMWLTGFDVECLSTLYIDKPMKAHTLMQAIARANRVYPGKDCGLIVDYNGMLKSLREALAQYALGDDEARGGEEIVAPIEERVQALLRSHRGDRGASARSRLRSRRADRREGFRAHQGAARRRRCRLHVATRPSGGSRSLARQVFIRFKALLMEPTAFAYAERHDNIEAIYKKLTERRDTADVTELLKELHRIVNEAIRTQAPGDDQAEGLTFDLSQIDFEKLRDEFAKKVTRKATALQDIRDIVEKKLAQMLARNPMRMDYYKKYQEIIADYNREKDRATVEETFATARRTGRAASTRSRSGPPRRACSEDELALFDLLQKDGLGQDGPRTGEAGEPRVAGLDQGPIGPARSLLGEGADESRCRGLHPRRGVRRAADPAIHGRRKAGRCQAVYAHVWQQTAAGAFGGTQTFEATL